MHTLHILRTEPDQTTTELFELVAEPEEKRVRLYSGDVDWDQLVEDIFAADKVISWW
ncbi:MAG: hypothetical protein K9K64_10725 [Desulfohalobiaceae bacterium]|nr:hypothetical protein [Desulfohalobiaceae bacterium]